MNIKKALVLKPNQLRWSWGWSSSSELPVKRLLKPNLSILHHPRAESHHEDAKLSLIQHPISIKISLSDHRLCILLAHTLHPQKRWAPPQTLRSYQPPGLVCQQPEPPTKLWHKRLHVQLLRHHWQQVLKHSPSISKPIPFHSRCTGNVHKLFCLENDLVALESSSPFYRRPCPCTPMSITPAHPHQMGINGLIYGIPRWPKNMALVHSICWCYCQGWYWWCALFW